MGKSKFMPAFKFEKEKYVQLMKSQGISSTLTQLQKDTSEWEYQAFEGEKGYQPEMWNELQKVREFSRELWDLALQNETT
jgi:hypothetical protein